MTQMKKILFNSAALKGRNEVGILRPLPRLPGREQSLVPFDTVNRSGESGLVYEGGVGTAHSRAQYLKSIQK